MTPLVGLLVAESSGLCGCPGGCVAPRASNTVDNPSLSNALSASGAPKGALLLSGTAPLLWWVCSGKQEEANEGAQPVHQCHHLCGQPTTGSANGLMLGSPPFCARSLPVNRDNGAVDEHHRLQIGMAAEDLESPRKHPAVYPSSKRRSWLFHLLRQGGRYRRQGARQWSPSRTRPLETDGRPVR